MVHRILTCLAALAIVLSSTGPMLAAQPAQQAVASSAVASPAAAAVNQALHASPVMFIENMGQWDAGVRFQVRGGNNTMWLVENAFWLTVVEPVTEDVADPAGTVPSSRVDPLARFGPEPAGLERDNVQRKAANIKLSFVGANPHPRIEPFHRLDTVVSYFLGNDSDQWRPAVPVWGGVRYVDLYPGVDLEVTSEGGQMVQRLAARPGADLSAVRLQVEGADDVTADGDALRLSTAAGEFVLPLLRADGLRVAGSKVEMRGARVFDVSMPFVTDSPTPYSPLATPYFPTDNPADLLYGTFLGGSSSDSGSGIAVDWAGSAYLTGSTSSSDFPTTPGALDTSSSGIDAFVVKLNPAGSGLVYATFLGGSSSDYGYDIVVNGGGSAYVTGSTSSNNFPTTPGALDTSSNGLSDAFVVKLNPAGSGLAYATLLGGSSHDLCSGIAVDGAGSAYMTGWTGSTNFPTTAGAFDTSANGTEDAFIVKLNSAGSALAYATLLGGSGADEGAGIAVDGAGSAYVTGWTGSTNFPTTAGAFDTSFQDGDAFVAKLNPEGSGLAYATFLGGQDSQSGDDIAVDEVGSAYLTGYTRSGYFPTTPGAFDTSFNGPSYDAFVVKLNPAGSGLVYGTFLGGSSYDRGYGIAVNEAGSAYVTGFTSSTGFPTTAGAFDTSCSGNDAFVVKLNPAGSGLVYATFLGGSSSDYGNAVAVDGAGNAYVSSDYTSSSDFPTTPDAFDRSYNDGNDVFAVKLALGSSELAPARLVYSGGLFLHGGASEVIEEADARITTGDHIHLSLPFTNNGGTIISGASIEVMGAQHSSGTPGVGVYDGSAWRANDGSDWYTNPGVATLSLGTVTPGATKYLDFWIYVTDSDPKPRKSSFGQTWIEVLTLTGLWKIGINLSPIDFSDPDGEHIDMTAGSCLHTPDNIEISAYAQYAAGACEKDDRTVVLEVCKPRTPPGNAGDPDTPAQAVRNLADRVNAEFHRKEGRYSMRPPDTEVLTNRDGDIGVCTQYADLTTGLLRSLNLPSRIVIGSLRASEAYQMFIHSASVPHAWSEVFLGSSESPAWKQVDSGHNWVLIQQFPDDWRISGVETAWADNYPLATASPWTNDEWRCVASCYQAPVDCVECQRQSNAATRPNPYNLSCVQDVTSGYLNVGDAFGMMASTVGGLLVDLDSPTSVIRSASFAISTGVTNDTLASLDAITTTIALREYLDSTQDLFEVAPPYQVLNDLGAGETITITWTITPLVAGGGLPLRFSAESGDLLEVTEQPLVVNEPGTLPDLSLTGVCGLGNASPGQEVTLSTSILDENLQAFSDPGTVITATVVATPTLQFSTTLTLSYCESCEAYQGALTLPDTAPVGRYEVNFEATHPSYDPAYATSGFFVVPPLTVSLSTNQSVVGVLDTITVTAQVMDRGAAVNGAAVSAEIITPGGAVTVPLYFDADSETYRLALHPANLAGNLGGEVLSGAWQVQASGNYMGGTGTDDAAFTVVGTYPLSEVVISKLETGAELTWPHMGSGVDHYEIYRSTSPYLSPGGADSVKLTNVSPASAAGDELSFTDADAFAEPGTSYFYVVQPVDANGQFYLRSNRVGAFNFTLTPGTAQ